MGKELDATGMFLAKVRKIPMLTQAEEIELSREVRAMLAVQASVGDRALTEEEQAIVRKGGRARKRMIRGNLRLVVSIAKQYARTTTFLTLQDLIGEGVLGLNQGILKFDPAKGHRLSTLIYWWIRQRIARAIKEKSYAIRRPGYSHENYRLATVAEERLKKILKRPPTIAEISAETGLSTERINRAKQAAQNVLVASLDYVAEEGDRDFHDRTPDRHILSPMEVVEISDTRAYIESQLDLIRQKDLLPTPQRTEQAIAAILAKYGWDDGRETGVTEFCNLTGASIDQVKRDSRKIMAALRQNIDREQERTETLLRTRPKSFA